MIWGLFSWKGKSDLMVTSGNMNSEKYCDVLEEALLPFSNEKHVGKFVFKLENGPCHTSIYAKQFLFDCNFEVFD